MSESRRCFNPNCGETHDLFYPSDAAWQTCPYCLTQQANVVVVEDDVRCEDEIGAVLSFEDFKPAPGYEYEAEYGFAVIAKQKTANGIEVGFIGQVTDDKDEIERFMDKMEASGEYLELAIIEIVIPNGFLDDTD